MPALVTTRGHRFAITTDSILDTPPEVQFMWVTMWPPELQFMIVTMWQLAPLTFVCLLFAVCICLHFGICLINGGNQNLPLYPSQGRRPIFIFRMFN
jgi:hypothetical protein